MLFAALLKNIGLKGTGVARPVAGAITGAVCLSGNLVVTRTTFALGLALGLGALLALVSGRLRVASALSVLTPLASPVAGLFLGVAGGALFLSGRRRAGVTLGVSALVPTVAVGMAFGNGGRQSFAEDHALIGFLVCLGVAGLCWRLPVLRWGALLSAGLVAAAYAVTDACGHDCDASARIVRGADYRGGRGRASGGRGRRRCERGPAGTTGIHHRGGSGATPHSASSSMRLLDQLAARGADGPIEVVPSLRRGEAAFVAPVVATARGWSRQVDIRRNPIFYDGTLNAATYRGWLDDNAISYVAIANGPYEWAATDEAALVRRGLSYLQPVWSDRAWTLYAVTSPRPVISFPGRVIARDPVSLTVSLPEPGEYVVRVRWSRYLSTSDGCMRPTAEGWSVLVVEPGTATIRPLGARHC